MNVIYTIEDGTGSADVRKWIEQNETEIEADERRSLVRDMYVRVYGRLAYFHNRITVAAFAIRPITDYNEITHHYLEAIYVHLTFTKPSKVKHKIKKKKRCVVNICTEKLVIC